MEGNVTVTCVIRVEAALAPFKVSEPQNYASYLFIPVAVQVSRISSPYCAAFGLSEYHEILTELTESIIIIYYVHGLRNYIDI